MSNTLYKSILSTYIPGSPGIPSDPGQQYQPAGYYWETQSVCAWKAVTTYTGASSGLISITEYVYACENKRVSVYREEQPYRAPSPAVAPVPSQFISDYQLGWDGGARSILSLAGDGYASFVVPHSNAGSFVGLNDADLSAGYMELDYAIYAHRGIAEVYENGVAKHYIGQYAEGAVFKIRRRRGVVTYLVDDAVQYTSLTPSTGTIFMDVSIYTGGHYIESPQLVEEFGADAHVSFLPMNTLATDKPYAAAEVSFEPMTASARTGIHMAVSFLPMDTLATDKVYAEAYVSFEPMTTISEAGMLKPSYGLSDVSMVPMGAYATCLTGEVASAHVSFEPMVTLSADRPYGVSHVSMLPPTTYAHALFGEDGVQGFSAAAGTTQASAQSLLAVIATSFGTGSSVILADVLLEASAMSLAEGASTSAIESVLSALAYSVVSANAVVSTEDQSPQVWVVNTENGGSTRYENYGFNSFAAIDGVYYGAKSDGIYRLDGADDDGLPIQAMLSFGLQKFGTSAMKRVPNAYLGCSSTGRLFMKLLVDGREYVYAARDYSEKMDTHRVDLGQGIRANYLEFELYNSDGDDFELESVEFVVAVLKRRI